MPQGIALIPLRLKFSEPPNLGSSRSLLKNTPSL